MTDQQTNWTPGAIANGHILIEGEGWVPLAEHERRQHAAQATAVPAPPSASARVADGPVKTKPSSDKPAWYKRAWVVGVAAGVLGLVLGAAASGSASPTDSAEYKSQAKELAAVKADLEKANADVESIAGDLPAREAALKDDQAQLTKDQKALEGRQTAVAAKERAVAKREKAVGIVEKEIEANTISGDGVYQVGVDIKAGTYKSSGGSDMCYYAENSDANGSNILSNNIVSGGAPAVTTVNAGNFFETSGCGNWVLQH